MKEFKIKSCRATKEGFGEGVLDAARINNDVFCLGADITASVGLDLFKNAFPERFYSLGIAEQNCTGVAAGLALNGKIPVFASYAVFSALRNTDQIRVSICYNNLHVIIGGAHSGISVGPDGATHQALEDIAVMRVLPQMTVISPCDATQTKIATVKAINELKGPVYIRYGRAPVPDFTDEKQKFEIGKAQLLRNGHDVTLFATGHCVWEALMAANLLAKKKIQARVINVHTIKPIDKETIIKSAKETAAVVTAEEHQLQAGFGSAVCEVLASYCPVPVEMVGMNNCFGESGKPDELIRKYKMTSEDIVTAALKVLKRKNV